MKKENRLMRLVSPRRMADDVQNKKVGKREFQFYTACFLLLVALTIAGTTGLFEEFIYQPYWTEYAYYLDSLVFIVGTLAIAYFANAKGDGRDFWYRFMCISFPIGVVVGVLGIALYIVGGSLGYFAIETYALNDVFLNVALTVLTFGLTWKYMTRVSSGSIPAPANTSS